MSLISVVCPSSLCIKRSGQTVDVFDRQLLVLLGTFSVNFRGEKWIPILLLTFYLKRNFSDMSHFQPFFQEKIVLLRELMLMQIYWPPFTGIRRSLPKNLFQLELFSLSPAEQSMKSPPLLNSKTPILTLTGTKVFGSSCDLKTSLRLHPLKSLRDLFLSPFIHDFFSDVSELTYFCIEHLQQSKYIVREN